MNDHEREKNYQLAREEIEKNINTPLDHEFIKKIHDLVVGPNGKHDYRAGEGTPAVGAVYSPPDSYLYSMEGEMQKIFDWFKGHKSRISIDELIAGLHWKLVKVHPFDDGNGRTARLLVIYVLRMHNYDELECKRLELYFEINKKEYCKSLNDGQISYSSSGRVSEQWLDYIRQALSDIKNQ